MMILKHISYSVYQFKTVNCCQPIQLPLKYLMIVLMDVGTALYSFNIDAKYGRKTFEL